LPLLTVTCGSERGQGEESERRRWREERFLREVQVLMKVQSPHICRCVEAGGQVR